MAVAIEVWFDFGCPFSYLLRRALPDELAGTGARVSWHACTIDRGVLSDPVWAARVWRHSVRPLAGRLEVAVDRKPPCAVATRAAALGHRYAVDHGRGDEYTERVFTAFFTRSQDIGDPGVLARAAAEAGLDRDDFTAAVGSRLHAHRRPGAPAPAPARRPPVRLTPTIDIGGYRLEGFPTEGQLVRLVAAAERDRSAAAGTRLPGGSVPQVRQGGVEKFVELVGDSGRQAF
ncbi:DsbA family protein [Streptomyces sp. NPDC020875]|uniref:DsbA family oxidoreductase n=1 Tax=Streptomyces sp. NPDC020875 TaxID=3154898 RepID=UPI0033FD2E3E